MTEYNIAGALARVAADRGEATGLVVPQGDGSYRSWSFAELERNTRLFAARLRGAGVERGDRVMLMVRPSMEFICLTFALFRLGAVVILIDPGMGWKNLLRCIGSVRPAVLVGIPRAQLLARLFPGPFTTVRSRICVGPSPLQIFGRSLASITSDTSAGDIFVPAAGEDLAAIIFTTGSTGPPKGVRYSHGVFHAQLRLIREYYGIRPGDVDQPGFPLFGLFSIALGARAVIPDMDPSRPARVDPARFIRSILDQGVTYSFGSPAIWNVVSHYCLEQGIRLPVQKILMAGAPVSGELIARVAEIMAPDGEIHTPYGATESLPVASISGREILAETWPRTRKGNGTCVGRPLPGIDIRIMETVDGPVDDFRAVREMAPGEIGEIVVRGPVVTRAYDGNEEENRLAKIQDLDGFWHRIGDMGYLDEQGRLWFCGRKAHRVLTEHGVLYSVCCEAIFNEHPSVFRSALVGVGEPGRQRPVLVVELKGTKSDEEELVGELQALARTSDLTREIETFLVHPEFPVDIRHNAKIFREQLAEWAGRKLHSGPCRRRDGL
ncbi:fatty acid CoA ligase family protein [Desulfolithobacter sp.]